MEVSEQIISQTDLRYESLHLFIAQELRRHDFREKAETVFEKLREHFETTYSENPDNVTSLRILGELFYELNELNEARAVFENLADRLPENIQWKGYLGIVLAKKGERKQAMDIMEQLRDWERPYLNGRNYFWMALIRANLGDLDDAVDLLAEAHRRGVPFTSFHLSTGIEPLQDYPGFIEFMKPRG